MRHPLFIISAWASMLLAIACSDNGATPTDGSPDAGADARAAGSAGGPCFPNNTCFEGLICQAGVCVEQTGVDGGVDQGGDPDGGGCQQQCQAGGAECVGDQLRLCIVDSLGCTSWTPPQPCPTDRPFCSNGVCEAQCSEECSQSGDRRCVGNAYEECGQHDSDSCLEWGAKISCATDEICRTSDGQCVPDCDGQPCACNEGETQTCADIGECSGGIRQCVGGEFGPCQWSAGPLPESCDGKDNDCNGVADEAEDLVAPPCAKQEGVCLGAVQQCGGTAGWVPCNDAVYKAAATADGTTYEVSETLCDGIDNDCDGQIDEPSTCCQPSCIGKACGADDGCGNPCQDGSCPGPQDVCQSGTCVCQPSCAGKVCGGPDGCGGSCLVGTCGPNEICNGGVCSCAFVPCDGICCSAGELCQQSTCVPGPQPGWKEVAKITTQKLMGIWGLSGSAIWAVGDAGTVLYYNGSQWSAQTSNTTADLKRVWGSSGSDVWAVGYESAVGGVIIHYDGSTWSEVSNLPYVDALDGVWGSGPGNVWAVGYTLGGYPKVTRARVLYYDGNSWTLQVPPPDVTNRLWGVWASSASDAWAVGYNGLRLHYDGVGWTDTQGSIAYDTYQAIWGVSASDIWVVGADGLLVHYDGNIWSNHTSPHGGTAGYYAVAGASSSDVWAVGQSGNIAYYNGSGWQISGMGVTTSYLYGVWAPSASDAWAVGSGGTILHYTP